VEKNLGGLYILVRPSIEGIAKGRPTIWACLCACTSSSNALNLRPYPTLFSSINIFVMKDYATFSFMLKSIIGYATLVLFNLSLG
jgi:hypothetical protein